MGKRENLPFNEDLFSTSVRERILLVKSAHLSVFDIYLNIFLYYIFI